MQMFCPWDVLSLGRFVPWKKRPWDISTLLRFFSWDILSLGPYVLGHFVPGTLCLGRFCPL